MKPVVNVERDTFKIEGGFAIARGSRTHAHVITVNIWDGIHQGFGECVPYARYGESLDGVAEDIKALAPAIAEGLTRAELQDRMKPGAARNALDCALWDLEAKRAHKPVHELLGFSAPQPLTTAFTISVGTPEKMREDAAKAADRPLLKVKLAGEGDVERIQAVRSAAPNSKLIVDANEGWTADNVEANLRACEDAGVALIEQPMAAGNDEALREITTSVLVCADESFHTADNLEALRDRYNAVNIKLDKTGGLTEGLQVIEKAKELDFTIMVGCMLGSSLAMAPAFYLAQAADFVDLDGPLLLAQDRAYPIPFEGSLMHAPNRSLWG
ncbi:N-acetyl-D-Glu racemase DgcA [Pseudovibrio sp. SPO723]|uniref:N-acetyl-D-Glu racemase DgcA n=1 Tax=Nesiotobacter zosterae TaxID=392721 RepID=UPI0029C2BFAD|nr:N-acetyl-D-Glu racemase DgcA [Pseudovibrio sp. SPO723]MDX5594119.1 N-acetyl-D-Glu racemase DgcA [Pseudovibrio sp. SPO723]